jgi:hypothetical protein
LSSMRRLPRPALAALLAALCACSQTIDVLSVVESAGAGAGAGAAAPPTARDAGPLPDPDDVGDDGPADASRPPATPCGPCGVMELCAAGTCVDSRGVTSLASSLDHTCRVADGRLHCFGDNEYGQLGTGDRARRAEPTRVGNFNDWLRVSTGERHTCALRAPGVLYCFGDNDLGQLGSGDTATRLTPRAIDTPLPLRDIACGGMNCCAIDEDGGLSCWGDNLEGKAGQDDPYGSPDVTRPLAVEPGARFRSVALGQGHVCAIRESGALACWGRNTSGELGIGPEPIQTRAPRQVGDARDYEAVAASQHHTCAVRSDGGLWCWGHNGHYELGTPEFDVALSTPQRMNSAVAFRDVAAGWFHTCALARDGRLYCWGRAIEGQLGLARIEPLLEPNRVAMPERWRSVTAGRFHTCGTDESGAVLCWGENASGQLGVGDDARRNAPEPVR